MKIKIQQFFIPKNISCYNFYKIPLDINYITTINSVRIISDEMKQEIFTTQNLKSEIQNFFCQTPEETFNLGEKFGETLQGGEIILLSGGLGAGKTLFTKGILSALEYDIDEVTSPSFTLVNQYDAKFTVYHIDLWRLNENSDAAFAVGLEEILEDENSVVIIEWAERLKNLAFSNKIINVEIFGDGDITRNIKISTRANL